MWRRSLNASENCNYVDNVKPTLKLLVEILLSSEGLGVEPFRQFLIQSVSSASASRTQC